MGYIGTPMSGGNMAIKLTTGKIEVEGLRPLDFDEAILDIYLDFTQTNNKAY